MNSCFLTFQFTDKQFSMITTRTDKDNYIPGGSVKKKMQVFRLK